MRPVIVAICCIVCWLWSASAVEAAVTISEVAWMGDLVSPNNEWIELYNGGTSAENVDSWVLTDSNNLNIPLSGTILPGTYVLLERNRTDGQYHSSSPLVIYTGALVNTGATLILRRADGSIADQVFGGENWQTIGGDNQSKETAQYTESGWRTGLSTPASANITSGTLPGTSSDQTDNTSQSKSGSTGVKATAKPTETVRLVIPNTVLSLKPNVQNTAYVNQTINFSVEPSGIGETWLNSLVYKWNFGDLATGSGKTTKHSYAYPGTYVATVEAKYGRHEQVARVEVTILPITLSLEKGPTGELLIHNNAPYDIDVSGYKLEGAMSQTFPKHSIMAKKSTLAVSPGDLTGGYWSNVRLRDAVGLVVAIWPDSTKDGQGQSSLSVVSDTDTELVLATNIAETVTDPVSDVVNNIGISESVDNSLTVATTSSVVIPEYVLTVLQEEYPETVDPPVKTRRWPYVVLVLVIITAVGSLLATTPKVSSSERKIVTNE